MRRFKILRTASVQMACTSLSLAFGIAGCTQQSGSVEKTVPASSAATTTAVAVAVAVAAKQPNLNGVWNRYPPYPDTFSPEPWPAELQVTRPPLKEPYLAAWDKMQKRREAADAAGKPLATPSSRCLPEGMPGLMGAHYAMEFLQTPGQITVLAEFMSQARRIYLDEPMPKSEEIEPSFNGYSVGRWLGDTLEVITYGVKPTVIYEDIPHSSAMKIVERIHFIGDILSDDFIIEDPVYLDGQYKFTFRYKREKPSYKIGDYFCENQQDVVGKGGTIQMRTK